MVAVYIDPLVCKTWAGWLIPECWGIAVSCGLALLSACLPLALACAVAYRTYAPRLAR